MLTHGHLDHCGLLPLLVKKGYRGPIYATTQTKQIAEVILLDSAKIQELNEIKNHSVELYNTLDVLTTLGQFVEVNFNEKITFKNSKIATVAQTTKKKEKYLEIVNYLILKNKEVRVFNTICDATFENQDAARELSKEVDIMIVIGGKNSSNTKQLHSICLENCPDSFLIENETELENIWFLNKKLCGVTAGASTPDWIIQQVVDKIKSLE